MYLKLALLADFGDLALTLEERSWLAKACPYFTPEYLDHLSAYRFKPEQVKLTFVPLTPSGKEGDIEMEAVGLWSEAIFWEVPLMATLSEIYFQLEETDWNEDGQEGALSSTPTSVSPNADWLRAGIREVEEAVGRRMSDQRVRDAQTSLLPYTGLGC